MRVDARLARQWTPTELGVHPAAGGSWPRYVRRDHDDRLRAILAPPVETSRLVVVRGEPATGATRSLWEAVADGNADWLLEYPRTAGALGARLAAGIPAGTVLWLGDLGRYVAEDGAAVTLDRLDDLLEEDGYLVAGTIWPWQWDACVAAVGAGRGFGDPAYVMGRMLDRLDDLSFNSPDNISPDYGGGVFDLPARFTDEELASARGSGDPLVAAAATPDGRLVQNLTGVPGLLRRYTGSDDLSPERAVLTAATDAVRLGHAGPLPATLLERSAWGYLADSGGRPGLAAWACADDGGLAGLSAVRADEGGGYRLAGPLDQQGRVDRQDQPGSAALWDALLAEPGLGVGDATRLGQAARDRGLYRQASALWTTAAQRGSADAAARLVELLRETEPRDAPRAAGWAATVVRLDDPWETARLLDALRAAGTGDAIGTLITRGPAGQADTSRRWDALRLLIALGAAGAANEAEALGARLVSRADRGNVPYLSALLRALGTTRADGAVRALVSDNLVQYADPEDLREAALLVTALHAAGPEARAATRVVAGWAAEHCDIAGPQAVAGLIRALRAAGETAALRRLLDRGPVEHGRLTDPWEAAALLAELRDIGDPEEVRRLLDRDPARVGEVDNADSVAWLLTELRLAGADEAIRVLLDRDPARHVDLYDFDALSWLATELRLAGDGAAIRTLAARVADLAGDIDDLGFAAEWLDVFQDAADEALRAQPPAGWIGRLGLDSAGDLARLLEHLVAARANEAVRMLLDRDPGGLAPLDDLRDVARLHAALRAAGADDAASALGARAARNAPVASLNSPGGTAALLTALHGDEAVQALLDRDPGGRARLDHQRDVARLLAALRGAGAFPAAEALARRAAGAGMFRLLAGDGAGFASGSEPDLTPSPAWRWSAPEPAVPAY